MDEELAVAAITAATQTPIVTIVVIDISASETALLLEVEPGVFALSVALESVCLAFWGIALAPIAAASLIVSSALS